MRTALATLLVLGGLGLLGTAGWDAASARLAQQALLGQPMAQPPLLGAGLAEAPPTSGGEGPVPPVGGSPTAPTGTPPAAAAGAPSAAPAAPTPGSPAPPAPEPALRQGAPLFRLEIPRIGVRNMVVYGSSAAALKAGPGLVERTALPGEAGNAVVAGHRDYYFWRLNEVVPGDRVTVTTARGTINYVVTGKRVVSQEDTSILDPTPYQQLTVFTCWPLIFAGRAPDRLVITAVPEPARLEQTPSGE